MEHASFTRLVFSATGGLGNMANTFHKRLASVLAAKQEDLYSSIHNDDELHVAQKFAYLQEAVKMGPAKQAI